MQINTKLVHKVYSSVAVCIRIHHPQSDGLTIIFYSIARTKNKRLLRWLRSDGRSVGVDGYMVILYQSRQYRALPFGMAKTLLIKFQQNRTKASQPAVDDRVFIYILQTTKYFIISIKLPCIHFILMIFIFAI
jgi:hypothetical protein